MDPLWQLDPAAFKRVPPTPSPARSRLSTSFRNSRHRPNIKCKCSIFCCLAHGSASPGPTMGKIAHGWATPGPTRGVSTPKKVNHHADQKKMISLINAGVVLRATTDFHFISFISDRSVLPEADRVTLSAGPVCLRVRSRSISLPQPKRKSSTLKSSWHRLNSVPW